MQITKTYLAFCSFMVIELRAVPGERRSDQAPYLTVFQTIRDDRLQTLDRCRQRYAEAQQKKVAEHFRCQIPFYVSLRAVGQRYRIIYRIEREKPMVWVIALGIRKEGSKRNIYTLAKKLLKIYFKKRSVKTERHPSLPLTITW
jgi:mRNA interferase RelE/StbE